MPRLERKRRRGGRERQRPAPFVVGMGRSGTTLLRMMLDSHPEVAIPPETWFVPHVIAAFEGGAPSPQRAVELLVAHSSWEDFGLPTADVLDRLDQRAPLTAAEVLRAFYEAYAQRVGKPRWGDKTPPYALEMRAIQRVLPEARFLHVIRDGRDVVTSSLEAGMLTNPPADLARWWRRTVRSARRQGRHLEHYLEVRYEELVSQPESTLRAVCGFLDLAWEDAVLGYHARAGERLAREAELDFEPIKGSLVVPAEVRRRAHALVSQPPRPDRIGRWEREMSPADVAAVEGVAADLLVELGYPVARLGA